MKFYDFRNSTGGVFWFWRIVVAVIGRAVGQDNYDSSGVHPGAIQNKKLGAEICRQGQAVDKSPLQCAGLNRHEAGEEEASRERSSDPLGPEFCVGHREVHDEA
jgi:hypothetical protein